MDIQKDDYLVVNYEGKKKALVQVIKRQGNNYTAVIADESMADEDTRVELVFGATDVIANVGKTIRDEKLSIAGVKLQPWRHCKKVNPWGTVHVYRDMPDNEERVLMGALKRVGRQIVELGLADHLPIDIHVRPPRGKWAGFYKPNAGDKPDVMTLHPAALKGSLEADYVVWHEDGHRIWTRFMTQKMRARWIKLYHSSVTLGEYDHKEIEALRRRFESAGLSVFDFREILEGEEELELFDEITSWIIGWNGLTMIHLDTLASANSADVVAIWPTRTLNQMDKTLMISEYGKTNAEEFFAEAWSFYFTKQDLPDDIKKWVEKTLKSIKS